MHVTRITLLVKRGPVRLLLSSVGGLCGVDEILCVSFADDREAVKQYWELICTKHDFIPVEIDKPLWLLNKYCDSDGRQYIDAQLEAIRS